MAKTVHSVSYESIVRDVKAGKIAPLYYLMGEEDYYIDRLCDFLLDALLLPEERDFNLDLVYGTDVTIDKVVELAKAYPMMAERRVVMVKEAQNLRSLEPLAVYMDHLTPSTVLIFSHKHGVLDRRSSAGKAIARKAVVYESKRLYESQLPRFITEYLKEKGLGIAPQALQMLSAHVGADLCRLSSEMDKLAISMPEGEKTVSPQQVEEQTGMSKEFNDFELTAALAYKDVYKANQILKYYEGNTRNFALPRTLSNLFTFFSDVLVAYFSPDQSERGVALWLDKSEWKVRQDILPARRNYSGKKVMRILAQIRKTDAYGKGVDGVKTSHEELLKELIFYILH